MLSPPRVDVGGVVFTVFDSHTDCCDNDAISLRGGGGGSGLSQDIVDIDVSGVLVSAAVEPGEKLPETMDEVIEIGGRGGG